MLTIPLKDGTEGVIDPLWVKEWCELYVAEDVHIKLHKARLWNLSHPSQRKTKRGLYKHLNSFMKDCRIKPVIRQVQIVREDRPEVSIDTRRSFLQELKERVSR